MQHEYSDLVEAFYQHIWNAGDLAAASDLLTTDFLFRGSLGAELRGQDAFRDYVRSIRAALAEYRCEILECVTGGDQAFAQMRFSGRHVGVFLGYPPTGKSVHSTSTMTLGAGPFRQRPRSEMARARRGGPSGVHLSGFFDDSP